MYRRYSLVLVSIICGVGPDLSCRAAGPCAVVHAEDKPWGGWEPARSAGRRASQEGEQAPLCLPGGGGSLQMKKSTGSFI